jgi:hypothetical protein
LNALDVGETFIAPPSTKKNNNFARFYMLAARLGIRVSVSTISETEMRITRVA